MVELAVSVGSIVAGLVLIVAAFLIIKLLKKFLVNTVLGVVVLLVVNYLGQLTGFSVKVPITIVTLVISAVLGLAGVGLLLILAVLGVKIA